MVCRDVNVKGESYMIPGANEIGGKASVASPNGALSPPLPLPLPPAEVLGGRALYENFFGLQRPLDSLKINSNLINCGYEAKQKS